MNIRSLADHDLEAIAAIADCHGDLLTTERVGVYWLFSAFFSGTSLVVEAEGEVVAYLLAFVEQDDPTTVYIHNIGVLPEHEGKGLASQMLDELSLRAKKQDIKRLHLNTLIENKRAIAFYQSRGFDDITEFLKVNKPRLEMYKSL